MNSLYQEMMGHGTQNNLSQVKGMLRTLQNSNNPQQLLMGMAQQNPKVQQVMSMIQNSGKSPKELFYQMAQQKGVDPEQILNMLR